MPTGLQVQLGHVGGLALPAAVTEAVGRLGDGCVIARNEDLVRTVWFSSGKVHAFTSKVENEMLGGWLIERGLADGAAVRRALAERTAGQRLGQVLVGAGVVKDSVLREELFNLAYTIAARLVATGGTIDAEACQGMPSDARTVELPPACVFAEAMLRTPDLDLLSELVGRGTVWEAVGTGGGVDVEPSESQRYLLSLLRPPKTLDALRRVVQADFADVVRDLAYLAAAGLTIPRNGQPAVPARSSEGGSEGSSAGPASPLLPGLNPRTLMPQRSGPDPRLRATLAEIEQGEREQAAKEGFVGRDGVLSGPELRRAERLLAAAEQQLVDCDSRGARRALVYAVETVPCAALLKRLGEIELDDPGTRHSGLQRLRQALALAPDYVEGWLVLASYWRQRGEADKERRCLDKILSVAPDEPEAASRIAEISQTD